MATILPGRFTRYDLAQTEFELGAQLSPLQKMVINNHIADLVDQRLNLHFDGEKPFEFAAQEAEIAGKIDSLQWLLDLSESVTAEIMQRAAQQARSQNND